MILLWSTFGMANRMFFFAHCLELAETTGQTLVSFNFPEGGEFESSRHGTLVVWPVPAKPGIRLSNFFRRCCTTVLRRYIPLTRKCPWLRPKVVWSDEIRCDKYSAANPAFVEEVRSRWLTIITGWISLEDMEIYRPGHVRTFFTPIEPIRTLCHRTVETARAGADVLVGIHIRWGDFEGYAQGAFYFPLEVYLGIMRHFLTLLSGRRVAFLVVCDQPAKLKAVWDSFQSMQVTLGPGTKLGDLYSLAQCDYIVSPGSTYSLWAAFYGKKPYWCLTKSSSLPSLADFVVPEDFLYHLHPDYIPWFKGEKPKRKRRFAPGAAK